MENIRNQLKALSRQYNSLYNTRVQLKGSLFWLISQSFPYFTKDLDIDEFTKSNPEVYNFLYDYWHIDTLKNLSVEEFLETIKDWSKKHDYRFDEERALKIYNASQSLEASLPKDEHTKRLIQSLIEQLWLNDKYLKTIKDELIVVSKKIPEISIIEEMTGVDDLNAAILVAEIGDVNRFEKRTAITSFAGLDPKTLKEQKALKCKNSKGKIELKRVLHEIIENIFREKPLDDPIYNFMQKKCLEGKSEQVCKTAGANKFLRIYYGKVKAYLNQNAKY